MTTAAPPLSVGLPVFNGEAYLQHAIDSVLAQDFADLELVIGDNGSTDGTEEMCREAVRRDARVSYHRSDTNRGAAWNFSRLVELARGRYFRWAAHDDACEPTYLRRCVEILEDRPDVSLCFSRILRIDTKGRAMGVEAIPTPATQRRAAARARSLLLQRYFPKAAPFGLMRLEQARTTGLIRPYKSSDRAFLLEMALQGRFHQMRDPLYLHRTHPDRSVFLPLEDRLSWWDGGETGRYFAQRWRLLRGYAEVVHSSPATNFTRVEVLGCLGLWMVQNVSPLSRELIRSVRVSSVRQVSTARDHGT